MTKDELVSYLGTIAHSGSKAFVQEVRAISLVDHGSKLPSIKKQFPSRIMVSEILRNQIDDR